MKSISYQAFCELAWEEISTKWQVKLISWSTDSFDVSTEHSFALCFECCKPLAEQEIKKFQSGNVKIVVQITAEDLSKIGHKFDSEYLTEEEERVLGEMSPRAALQLRNFEISIWKLQYANLGPFLEQDTGVAECLCPKPLIVGIIDPEVMIRK